VALSLNAVLHFVPDDEVAYRVVRAFKDALPLGSSLAISHATGDFNETLESAAGVYRSVGTGAKVRTREEFARFFEGWDVAEPGVVASHRWRPDRETEASMITDAEASVYAAVARKIA
jgi:hypothetical protein